MEVRAVEPIKKGQELSVQVRQCMLRFGRQSNGITDCGLEPSCVLLSQDHRLALRSCVKICVR